MAAVLGPCCTERPLLLWGKVGPHDAASASAAISDEVSWERRKLSTAFSCAGDMTNLAPGADVVILSTSANIIRKCDACRQAFTSTFQMPASWWAEYCRNANGYFGSTTTTNREGNPTGINSWSRFLVKLPHSPTHYEWYKINVFVRWLPASQQTVILLFDAPPSLQKLIPSPLLDGLSRDDLGDPFWIYPHLVEEIVRLQDTAVWKTRTQLRTVEKERALVGNPNPNHGFAHLNDLARHMIHVSETLDVGVNTIGSILLVQAASMNKTGVIRPPRQMAASQAIHDRLIFLENMLENLRHRSTSNKQRLDNEVQLAFHMVTQYDATLSHQLNQSMQSDSSAMKTISVLALTFLPATFISAIFSMSFFTNDAEAGWTMSSRIWIYWAFAIPVTLMTTGLWFSFQRRWLGSR